LKLLAQIVSVVFQPLLMPSLVFYTYLFHIDNSSNLTEKGRTTVLVLIFLTTCVIPVFIVLLFRFTKVIKDLHMKERRERYLPFAFISVFYILVTYLMSRQVWFNPTMAVVMISMTTVVITTNLITYFWKISAHAAGVAGWLGFIMVFSRIYSNGNTLFWPLIIAVMLTGIVIWSRLYLNAHKPSESLAGFVLGFLVCFSSVLLFV